METPKNITKQIKLPMLRQSSEHKIMTATKLQALKRQNSSQNIMNQSIKSIFKLRNGEQPNSQTKTLLKSGGTFSRPSLTTKIDGKQALYCIKNSKLLKKVNDLNSRSKENFHTQSRWKEIQKDKLYQTVIEPSIEPIKVDQDASHDQQLRRSISQFYQSYLSTGVTLKSIDLQQD